MKQKIAKWLDNLNTKNRPDEFEAKQLMALYSIRVPAGKRLEPGKPFNIDALCPPYVLKVCSSEILHKTELKGVILNIDRETILENYKELQTRFPGENILIEAQTGFMGPEFIVGVIRDPALGHAVMVGAGGILTEIYKDTAFRLAPCTEAEAMDMLEELAISPVFENFRGLALDKEKLARTISRVSQLASDLGDALSQLDINPIVFSDGEWTALDAKVMLEPES